MLLLILAISKSLEFGNYKIKPFLRKIQKIQLHFFDWPDFCQGLWYRRNVEARFRTVLHIDLEKINWFDFGP